MRIALMISGNLGLILFQHLLRNRPIQAVFTDRGSEEITRVAEDKNIPCFVGNPRKGRVTDFIENKEIDVLLSINYLFLIEEDLIHWPSKIAVNFHGSLLPKYRGRTPHVWSIINNEKKTGITAHLISPGCDEGGILNQQEVTINEDDTGAGILKKYNSLYPAMVEEVLSSIELGTYQVRVQDESKATYFGKRAPDDGKIEWGWSRERIRNWVRAQAHPYPGAFSWLQGRKVIIDKVDFDDFGFDYQMANGLILSVEPIRVKTPNGVLRLSLVRTPIQGNIENAKFECNEN